MIKNCIVCGEEFEAFGVAKYCGSECRAWKQREYFRRYRAENIEKARGREKRYRAENREKRVEYFRRYHEENREKRLEYSRRYNAENREKALEDAKRYRAENREKVLEDEMRYRLKNKEKLSKQRAARAKLLGKTKSLQIASNLKKAIAAGILSDDQGE